MGWSNQDSGGWSGSRVLWTPSALGSALVAWWDAQDTADIILSGSNVTSWTDKVGAVAATQSTGANQPTWSATARNGKAGLTFNGTTDVLVFPETGTSIPVGTAAVTTAVAGFFNNTNQGYAFAWGASVAGESAQILANSTTVSFYDGTTVFGSAESWGSVDRFVVVGIAAGGTAGTFNVDGLATENFTPAVNTVITGFSGTIGAFINGTSAPFTGVVQQIVIANRILTADEEQKLEGWESWYDGKAGSNLPGGHPYKSRAPFTSDP